MTIVKKSYENVKQSYVQTATSFDDLDYQINRAQSHDFSITQL